MRNEQCALETTNTGVSARSCRRRAPRPRARGRVALRRRVPHHRAGFNLVELIVVIAVAVVMIGLLLPTLSGVRENIHKVLCASNQRQLGLGFVMFARDHNDWLPPSQLLLGDAPEPRELMSAHLGGVGGDWDGIGLLFSEQYVHAPECFYCPSHRGDHTYERYAGEWWELQDTFIVRPTNFGKRLYTNYHYAGHVDWENQVRRRLEDGETLVLAADGFRTVSEMNHESGMNILRADGSVRWREGLEDFSTLVAAGQLQDDVYRSLWKQLSEPAK